MHPAESRSFPTLGKPSRHFAGATSVRSWNVNNLASTNCPSALPL
jgi:hypothetical protein